MDAFYVKHALPGGDDAYTTLLQLLRDQLVISDVPPTAKLLARFHDAATQLQLLRSAESFLLWRPPLGDDVRNEPFPALLAAETTAFRHGPPGCEELLRSLYSNVGEELLWWLLRDLATAPERRCEADCFVLGQFLCEIASDREGNPMVWLRRGCHADDVARRHAADARGDAAGGERTLQGLAGGDETAGAGADATAAAVNAAVRRDGGGGVCDGGGDAAGPRAELRSGLAGGADELSRDAAAAGGLRAAAGAVCGARAGRE